MGWPEAIFGSVAAISVSYFLTKLLTLASNDVDVNRYSGDYLKSEPMWQSWKITYNKPEDDKSSKKEENNGQ